MSDYPKELVTTYPYVPPVDLGRRKPSGGYTLNASGMHHNGKTLHLQDSQGTSRWQEPEWILGLNSMHQSGA
jgi:hypothetical protein